MRQDAHSSPTSRPEVVQRFAQALKGPETSAGGKREARSPRKDCMRASPGRATEVPKINRNILSPLPGLFLIASFPGAARCALAPGWSLGPLRGPVAFAAKLHPTNAAAHSHRLFNPTTSEATLAPGWSLGPLRGSVALCDKTSPHECCR